MKLSTLSVLLGLGMGLPQIYGLVNPQKFAASVRRFPRNIPVGVGLMLLGTAFFPILGVEFGWVTVHWVTGLVLMVAVAFHVVRVLIRRKLGSMRLGAADVRDGLAIVNATLRRKALELRTGKYSFAQKLIHHAFAVVVLTTLITGGLMLARIDTPWMSF